MRKLFITFLLSLMTLTSHAQNMKLGDINHDNQVDISDVVALVNIVLNGYTPFSVSPTEVTLQVGGTANVPIFGGYYVYEVVSANPGIVTASVNGFTVSLHAVAGGETTVTVRDVLTFRTIDIPVVVNYESLQVSTNELSLIAGERGIVDINSGSGSYQVQSSDANIATATVSGGKVTVNAVGAGAASITVTDTKTNQTASINVNVDYKPIALSSSSLGLSIGNESRVSVTSGSGSYHVLSSDANVATAVMDGNSVVVTAVGGGTATITVTDTNSGKSATIAVMVEFFPLTLSASSLQLKVGDEETVSITSGNASFTLMSSNSGVATAKLVGFSVKVAAVGAGTATITVTDRRSGETATIEVTVADNQPQSYLTCPDNHHPHMIDLGLPSGTKWACCNVGANKPEDYGGYYAWGETVEKDSYNWSTYIHCDGTEGSCQNLGSDITGTQFDVAHEIWGSMWVMPSKKQIDELINECIFEWTTENGVKGGKFTSKTNDGSIFLPAAGYRWGAELYDAGNLSFYWSSTLHNSSESIAYDLYFNSNSYDAYRSLDIRGSGRSVRPVR